MTELRTRITGKNIDVGDALRSKIEDDLQKGIAKYASARDGEAVVIITKERHLFCVDILLHLDSKVQLEAAADADDPHAAFAIAQDKLEKQVRRYKRKLKDHHLNAVPQHVVTE